MASVVHSKAPIDINGKIYICDEKCLFNFDNIDQTQFEATNDEERITIKVATPSFINFLTEEYCPEYDRYELREILVNGPSRHSLYGRKFSLEFELLYYSPDGKEIVALSVFGEPSAPGEPQGTSKLVTDLTGKLFPQYLKTITASYQWSVNDLLPKEKSRTYFSYQRSKQVRHIIFETPIVVPVQLVENFKNYVTSPTEYGKALSEKNRPVKGDLVIYATVPPPINRTPVPPKEEDTVEGFEGSGKSATGSGESVEQDYGFAAVVALMIYFIILFLVLMVIYLGGGNISFLSNLFIAGGSSNMTPGLVLALFSLLLVGLLVYLMTVSTWTIAIGIGIFSGSLLAGVLGILGWWREWFDTVTFWAAGGAGVVGLSVLVFLSMGTSASAQYISKFGNRVVSYLGWYTLLLGLSVLVSRYSDVEYSGPSFSLDRCPDKDAIAIPVDEFIGIEIEDIGDAGNGEPISDYGYAEPTDYGYAEPADYGYADAT